MLFAAGYWIYAQTIPALLTTVLAIISSVFVFVIWKKVN
jgi:regulatory protein YycH of two-component signal transduction system YycFG